MKSAHRVGLSLIFLAACSSGPPSPTTPHSGGIGHLPGLPARACPQVRAAAALPAGTPASECHTDADCTAGHNGRCLRLHNDGPHGPSLDGSTCSYDACFTDADCGAHQTCLCGSGAESGTRGGHVCAGGECDTDAECGAGHYCRRGPAGKFCHSPSDQCVEETNCGDEQACTKNPSTGIYECAHTGSIVG